MVAVYIFKNEDKKKIFYKYYAEESDCEAILRLTLPPFLSIASVQVLAISLHNSSKVMHNISIKLID